MVKEITIEIKHPEAIVMLLILAIFLFFEMQITFNSPVAFGDEAYHARMAEYVSVKGDYPVWDPNKGTNLLKLGYFRPPLWHMLVGGFYLIFGFNDIIIKFLTPLIGTLFLGSISFLFGKKVFNKKIGFIAAIIAVTLPTIITYSVLFYDDILFVFYFSMFVLTFLLATESEHRKYWIAAGIFGALAALSKPVGYVTVPFLIIFYFVYQSYKQGVSKIFKNYVIMILLLGLLFSPFMLRNLVYFKTPICGGLIPLLNQASCSKIFQYKNIKQFETTPGDAGSEASILKAGVINYFNFVYGNIWFVPFTFLCGLFILASRKKDIDIKIIFIILAFLLVFYVEMKGRLEELGRHTLGLAFVVALISANFFERIYDFLNSHIKWVGIIVFVLVVGLCFLGLRDKLTGMKQVKAFSPSFFEATNFIKQNTSQAALVLTVWEEPTIYNSQRNSINIGALPDSGDIALSGDLNLTLSRLKQHGITHIFIQKFSINPSYLPIEFVQFLEKNPENFVKIYENGPQLQQCLQAGGCDGTLVYEIKYG